MGTVMLATVGGFLASFLATSAGSLLSARSWEGSIFQKFRLSIDFALGIMLSAVAFSLVGPTFLESFGTSDWILPVLGLSAGIAFVVFLHRILDGLESVRKSGASRTQMLLALALMAHNFPEGMASGAAMAGLDLKAAIPILSSIAIQNVPEGLLMVVCLLGMGWSRKKAMAGAIASGLFEWAGAITAGVSMSFAAESLPILLMAAGGAMFASVALELRESPSLGGRILKPEFALGLAVIPLMNAMIG